MIYHYYLILYMAYSGLIKSALKHHPSMNHVPQMNHLALSDLITPFHYVCALQNSLQSCFSFQLISFYIRIGLQLKNAKRFCFYGTFLVSKKTNLFCSAHSDPCVKVCSSRSWRRGEHESGFRLTLIVSLTVFSPSLQLKSKKKNLIQIRNPCSCVRHLRASSANKRTERSKRAGLR